MFLQIVPLNILFSVPLFLFPSSRIPLTEILELLCLPYLLSFILFNYTFQFIAFINSFFHVTCMFFSSVIFCLYRFQCGLHFSVYFFFHFFLNFMFFINFSDHLFSKLLYHCIKLFTYFINSFEIMARLLITSKFLFNCWQHCSALFFKIFVFPCGSLL